VANLLAWVSYDETRNRKVVKGWLQLDGVGMGRATFVNYPRVKLFRDLFGDMYVLEEFDLVAKCVIEDVVFEEDRVTVTVRDLVRDELVTVTDEWPVYAARKLAKKILVFRPRLFPDCLGALMHEFLRYRGGGSEWVVQKLQLSVQPETSSKSSSSGRSVQVTVAYRRS